MANLPLNETYNTAESPDQGINFANLNKLTQDLIAAQQKQLQTGESEDLSSLQAQLDARGISGFRAPDSRVSDEQVLDTLRTRSSRFPTPTPGSNTMALPENYLDRSGFRPGAVPIEGGGQWADPSVEDTVLRSIPGMQGQYVLDKSQPDQFVRSGRVFDKESQHKDIILDGRASFLYNVDHIIPLWAGGADTEYNWQVLTNPEHRKKTKAESVAWTLWSHGKIDQNKARQYVLNWQNRDLTDIPDPIEGTEDGDYGRIPLDIAEDIAKRWDEQAGKPKPVTMKEVIKGIPDTLKESGIKRGMQFDANTENMPGFIQSFVQDFANGLTAGWVHYEPEVYEERSGFEKTTGVIGNIAGMLLGLGKLKFGIAASTSAIRAAGSTLSRFTQLSKALRQNKWLTARLGIKGATEAADIAKSGGITSRSFKRVKPGLSNETAKFMDTAEDYFKEWVPAFVAYGQVSETFSEQQRRMERLFEDIIFGGLTAFVPAGLTLKRGIVPLAPKVLNATKGEQRAAQLAVAGSAATFAFMMGLDEENPELEALILGVVMGALHGPSSRAFQKEVLQRVNEGYTKVVAPEAKRVFSKYTGRKVTDKDLQNQESIAVLRAEAHRGLNEAYFGSSKASKADVKRLKNAVDETEMSYDNFVLEHRKIQAMGEWLETQSIQDISLRTQRIIENMYSLVKGAEKRALINRAKPNIENIVRDMPQSIIDNSFSIANREIPSGRFPTSGEGGFDKVKLTGMGETVTLNWKNVRDFNNALNNGKASRTLVAVKRPDKEDFLRGKSSDPNLTWTDSDPKQAIAVYGVIWDEAGFRRPVELGWWPQAKRIIKQNEQNKGIASGAYKKYQTNLNKDIIGKKMDDEGLEYLFVNLDNTGLAKGPNGKESIKYPFVEITLNDANWKNSLAHRDAMRKQAQAQAAKTTATPDSQSTKVKEVTENLNKKVKAKEVTDFTGNLITPAYKLLDHPTAKILGPRAAEMAVFQDILLQSRNALSQPSPAALKKSFNDNLAVKLTDDVAEDIFNRRGDITVAEILKIVKKHGAEEVKFTIDNTVFPLLQSVEFRQWKKAKGFGKAKVLGGTLDTAEVPTTPVTKTAQTTTDDAAIQAKNTDVEPKAPEAPAETAPVDATPQDRAQLVLPLTSRMSEKAGAVGPKPTQTTKKAAPVGKKATALQRHRVVPAKSDKGLQQTEATLAEEGRQAKHMDFMDTRVVDENTLTPGEFARQEFDKELRAIGKKATKLTRNDKKKISFNISQSMIDAFPNIGDSSKAFGFIAREIPQLAGKFTPTDLTMVKSGAGEWSKFFTRFKDTDPAKNPAGYFLARAFDKAMTDMLGPEWIKIPRIKGVLDDYFNNVFSRQFNPEGREITQPMDVFKARAVGDKEAERAAYAARNKNLQEAKAGSGKREQTNLSQQEIRDKGVEAGEEGFAGMRVQEAVQDEGLARDLTVGEDLWGPVFAEVPTGGEQTARAVLNGFLGYKGGRDGLRQYILQRVPTARRYVSLDDVIKQAKNVDESVAKKTTAAAASKEEAAATLPALEKELKMLDSALDEPAAWQTPEILAEQKARREEVIKQIEELSSETVAPAAKAVTPPTQETKTGPKELLSIKQMAEDLNRQEITEGVIDKALAKITEGEIDRLAKASGVGFTSRATLQDKRAWLKEHFWWITDGDGSLSDNVKANIYDKKLQQQNKETFKFNALKPEDAEFEHNTYMKIMESLRRRLEGKTDGSGGPGYMDGEGGFLGDAFNKVRGFITKPFTGDVIKYKRPEENVVPPETPPAQQQTVPKTPPKAPEKPKPLPPSGTQFAGVIGALNPQKAALSTPTLPKDTVPTPTTTPKATFPSLSATKDRKAPVFDRDEFRSRIVNTENEGVPESELYRSVGVTGDLGKYQASPATVRDWSEAWLGRQYSPEEFLNDPEAQEAFFKEFLRVAERYNLTLPEAAVTWHRGWGELGTGPRETREARFRARLAELMQDEISANYLAKFDR